MSRTVHYLSYCRQSSSNLRQITLSQSSVIKQRGFTLIEILVALVIFVMASVLLDTLSTQRIKDYQRNIDRTMKAWIATNQLVESQMNGANDKVESIEYANREWQVEWQLEDLPETKYFKLITITVVKEQELDSAKTPPYLIKSLIMK